MYIFETNFSGLSYVDKIYYKTKKKNNFSIILKLINTIYVKMLNNINIGVILFTNIYC